MHYLLIVFDDYVLGSDTNIANTNIIGSFKYFHVHLLLNELLCLKIGLVLHNVKNVCCSWSSIPANGWLLFNCKIKTLWRLIVTAEMK